MKPATPRGEATRTRILEAAAELIHLRGVSATSVDLILERAEAGKSQFYHYFDDKDELVREVLRFQAARDSAVMAEHLPDLDSWEGIRSCLAAMVEIHRKRNFVGGCPIGSLAAEMTDRDDRLRKEIEDAFETKRRALATGLRTMKARGDLSRAADPEELATFVLATLQGGLLLAATARDEKPLAEALSHAYRHLRSHATVGKTTP